MPKKSDAIVDDGWRIPDALWAQIEPRLPPPPPHPKGGRPWLPARQAMDGLFFLLRTGCQWKALPRSIAAGSTVHDRFQGWREADVFRQLWAAGLLEYDTCKGLDWEWQAMDGAMTKAPLGGGRDGAQPDGPRETGHEALAADGGTRAARGAGRGRGQPA